ncbi:GNAT family N-acetyltransferase [Laceyella tengchongensis]
MVDVRLLHADELKTAVRLSDETFRTSSQPSMAQAFPHVFSSSLGQSYGAFADGRLVSFVGLVPSVVRIGRARLNVYSIGSVCTHPDYRGKGIAGLILRRILAHIDEAEASLLLVSGYGPLYERIDCFRFGTVTRFMIGSDSASEIVRNASADADVHLRELGPTDWFKVTELARKREVRFEQSVWDIATLMEAEANASCMNLRHRVLIAEEEGQVKAFAVVAVPADEGAATPALAIEWAGEPRLVALALAHAVKRYRLGRLDAPVLWHEAELAQALAPAEHGAEQNLGTVRIVHPERLIQQLRPYLQEKHQRLGASLEVQALPNGRAELRLDGEKVILDAQAFVSLLFDPASHTNHLQGSLSVLKELFPIPLPYAGGLNYV